MIYPLVKYNDPILKQELEKFDFANPPTDPIQLAHDLAETMISNNGLGLAANQIGLPYRVFAVTGEKIVVAFNPILVDLSQEKVYLEEGCLSFPDLFVKVKRPRKIKVRYTEPNGNVVTATFDGLTSRIWQHEYSHLEGRTMKDIATSYHWEQGLKKQRKAQLPKPASFQTQQIMARM